MGGQECGHCLVRNIATEWSAMWPCGDQEYDPTSPAHLDGCMLSHIPVAHKPVVAHCKHSNRPLIKPAHCPVLSEGDILESSVLSPPPDVGLITREIGLLQSCK